MDRFDPDREQRTGASYVTSVRITYFRASGDRRSASGDARLAEHPAEMLGAVGLIAHGLAKIGRGQPRSVLLRQARQGLSCLPRGRVNRTAPPASPARSASQRWSRE